MNYLRKIEEAKAERKKILPILDYIEKKCAEYEFKVDELDDLTDTLYNKGYSFYLTSDDLLHQKSVLRTRMKRLKKSVRMRRKLETYRNKSHCCFVLGFRERQIGGRLHGRGIGHKLLCEGRDATDIMRPRSLGLYSLLYGKQNVLNAIRIKLYFTVRLFFVFLGFVYIKFWCVLLL
jgi:hypothetical protein